MLTNDQKIALFKRIKERGLTKDEATCVLIEGLEAEAQRALPAEIWQRYLTWKNGGVRRELTTHKTPVEIIDLFDTEMTRRGEQIRKTVKNICIALENDKRLNKMRFNLFSNQDYYCDTDGTVRPWTNADDSMIFSILQTDYGFKSRADYMDAFTIISRKQSFHPVRELLSDLVWDGVERVANGKLLQEFLGCEPSRYNTDVFKTWMLGAYQRVFSPGIKFDICPILCGKQGIGKSSVARYLSLNNDWFNDSLDSLDDGRAVELLQGSWIVELSELRSLSRTNSVESTKRFLSATADKIRLPYQKRAEIFERQCVFLGTTNKTDFLSDLTGNRRFFPIACGVVEPTRSVFDDYAPEYFRQCWAEIASMCRDTDVQLIIPAELTKEAREAQESAMQDEPLFGMIDKYLSDNQKTRTCCIELWQEALNEQGRPPKWQSTELATIICSIPGWKKSKSPMRFGKYGLQRGFVFDGCKSIQNDEQMEIPF